MAIQPRRNCQCILDMQPRPERRHNLGVDETPRQGCFVSLTSLVRQPPRPPRVSLLQLARRSETRHGESGSYLLQAPQLLMYGPYRSYTSALLSALSSTYSAELKTGARHGGTARRCPVGFEFCCELNVNRCPVGGVLEPGNSRRCASDAVQVTLYK